MVRAFWLIPALLTVALIWAANDRESGLPMWFELREERRQSDIRIAGLRHEVEALQAEVDALANDPAATERAMYVRLFSPNYTPVGYLLTFTQ